jgi:hypothetical protein
MREDENEICVLTWQGVLEPQYRDAFDRWFRAQRYSRACEFVARQLALKAAGAMHQAYFKKHRARLMAEAAELIARSPELARWRFPQGVIGRRGKA